MGLWDRLSLGRNHLQQDLNKLTLQQRHVVRRSNIRENREIDNHTITLSPRKIFPYRAMAIFPLTVTPLD